MCGICGALGSVDDSIVQAVQVMNETQTHRGPDAGDLFVEDRRERRVALAHRRLSIIDLRPEAGQPMTDPDSGNVIVYNGEVYNFEELRKELEADGETFFSKSDTEVVLKGYKKWGEGVLKRLRGMFALALWDRSKERCLLARDRLGIKPLYYTEKASPSGGKLFLFASEVRSLLSSGLIDKKLNPTGLSSYIWNGFVAGDETVVRGVYSLPAGTSQWIDAEGKVEATNRYWDFPDPSHKGSLEKLQHELQEAVKLRLVSDVPLGVFLSGGVDSSAVAALAARNGVADLKTFNISFEEVEYDESPYADRVAKSLGTDHHTIKLGQSYFKKHLLEALEGLDQPTFDAVNTYFVSRAAREAGMTVALAGTGGDEVFGGYKSFLEIPSVARWGKLLGIFPNAILKAVSDVACRVKFGKAGAVPPQVRWGKLFDVLSARGNPLKLYQSFYGLFTQSFYRELLATEPSSTTHGLQDAFYKHLEDGIQGRELLDGISLVELSTFLGQRLLRDTDTASMAVSLEVRVPLIDHEIIEAAFGLQTDERFKDLPTKRLLRELALSELDPDIFDRPKAGFVLPIDVWCREELKEMVTDLLQDESLAASIGMNSNTIQRLWQGFNEGAPGLYWSRVWSIFVLLWWVKRYNLSL